MLIKLPVPRPDVPGDRARYPYSRLAIGDEFLVPSGRASFTTVREMVRRRMLAKPGPSFRVVQVDGGTLVTRIA